MRFHVWTASLDVSKIVQEEEEVVVVEVPISTIFSKWKLLPYMNTS